MNLRNRIKNIQVLGPAYYGTPQPEFNPLCINESKFCHELRYKEYHISYCVEDDEQCDSNYVLIKWTSQEWPENEKCVNSFVDEVIRAIQANLNNDESLYGVNIKLEDRDGRNFRDIDILGVSKTTHGFIDIYDQNDNIIRCDQMMAD